MLTETLDSDRLTAARQVLEVATDEQVQRILLMLAEQAAKGGALFCALAFVFDWS